MVQPLDGLPQAAEPVRPHFYAARMVPERTTYAVEKLDVQPDDRILEIGCGRGMPAELICARLKHGSLTAIDRSAVASKRPANETLTQWQPAGRCYTRRR